MRKLPAYAALALLPAFTLVFVTTQFGAGVGVAATAAMVTVFATGVAVNRAAPGWPLRHEGGAFFFTWTLLATLLFSALAGIPLHPVTRWPLWGCVSAAAALSLAMTAGVWPAQRRFYAGQRALAAKRSGQKSR